MTEEPTMSNYTWKVAQLPAFWFPADWTYNDRLCLLPVSPVSQEPKQ